MEGKVKFFNTMKGYGFIIADDGQEYFVHYSGLADDVRIKENDAVVFDVVEGDRGPKAVNVSLKQGSDEESDEDSLEEDSLEEDSVEEQDSELEEE